MHHTPNYHVHVCMHVHDAALPSEVVDGQVVVVFVVVVY